MPSGTPQLLARLLVASLLVAFGCGAPQPLPPPKVSQPTDPRALCARVCAIDARCHQDRLRCEERCRPISLLLATEVMQTMVGCVEAKSPPECETGDAGVASRKQRVSACVVEATETKGAAARTNIEVFAKAYCERAPECTAPEGLPAPPRASCRADAVEKIRDTGGATSWSLYGALRPSAVDDLARCLAGPCAARRDTPDGEVERCLTDGLAKASAP